MLHLSTWNYCFLFSHITVQQRFRIQRNQPVEKQLVLDELAYKVDIPTKAIHDDVGKLFELHAYLQGCSQPHSPGMQRFPLSKVFLKLSFFSLIWLSAGWTTRPPGKALASPLLIDTLPNGNWGNDICYDSTEKFKGKFTAKLIYRSGILGYHYWRWHWKSKVLPYIIG